ncbi:flagellar protein [Paenibacillus sp. ACRRX]|uniref:flagellar protein n=1 Tax=unclassified Paenibacillus TaxID=185978 RepID=UPI001EF60423|nr:MULTISPECIES: flagellar protein [unclassified Paenibacillus]MCG7408224.1 flagellar protein [Paenibacillus sp. ACRRX]MDK8181391.1 flagellar protein [Paenibacillus sp. UMB4589-SE434]
MTINVDNCKRCGKIFQKYYSVYCPDCFAFIRSELDRCAAYLKKHRDSTIQDLSEATEVPAGKIIRYINEGKLYVQDYPNLHYECYFCDKTIQRGYLCPECAAKFKLEVKHLFLEDGYEYDSMRNEIKYSEKAGGGRHITDRYTVDGTKRK